MENDNTNTLIAIVQSQDADLAEAALKEIGISSYQLPSVGGFLGRKSVTLVIPCAEDSTDQIIEVLRSNCRQRIEYVAMPMESQISPIPAPTAVNIGGATIFGIESEQTIIL